MLALSARKRTKRTRSAPTRARATAFPLTLPRARKTPILSFLVLSFFLYSISPLPPSFRFPPSPNRSEFSTMPGSHSRPRIAHEHERKCTRPQSAHIRAYFQVLLRLAGRIFWQKFGFFGKCLISLNFLSFLSKCSNLDILSESNFRSYSVLAKSQIISLI